MKKHTLLLTFILSFIFSCKKDSDVQKKLPEIETIPITALTPSSATSGGNVLDDGGSTVTNRGVVWSTTPSPVDSLMSKTNDGGGNGRFESKVSNLKSDTRYFIRAYATNSVGTSYGNQIEFTTNAYDLYTCGLEQSGSLPVSKFWTNSNGTNLSNGQNSSRANDIFVKGTDVYVIGLEVIGGRNRAVLWKNNVATYLAPSTQNSNATSVFVDEGDVYVSGSSVGSSSITATVWKNGSPAFLTSSSNLSNATSVFVSNKDVYVSGYESTGSVQTAKIWKNGALITSIGGASSSQASSVYVLNNDVYAAGWKTISGVQTACYWKNNTEFILGDTKGLSLATSIYVNNGDVYISGMQVSMGSGLAKPIIWKNGIVSNLVNSDPYEGRVNDIAIKGVDIFAIGLRYDGTRTVPAVWRNGELLNLISSTSYTELSAIFVK